MVQIDVLGAGHHPRVFRATADDEENEPHGPEYPASFCRSR